MTEGWIEEGLFYRGPQPPTGHGAAEDWVELPHEHYLPISKARILRALREEQPALAPLIQRAGALLHLVHHRRLDELKEDYELLAPGGVGETLDKQALEAAERRFLANFVAVARKANFIPYSEPLHQRAISQRYLLDVPVEVDWSRHDPRPIKRFLDATEKEEALKARTSIQEGSVRAYLELPASFGEGALVFYRGIDRTQTEGRFVLRKVDRLVGRGIRALTFPLTAPIEALVRWWRGRRSPKKKPTEAPEKTHVFERRWVRRKNLGNQPLLSRLFSPSKLQEPTLRQVVALFRLRPGQSRGVVGTLLSALPGRRRERALFIKLFRDVPLADSEIVFPEKKIRMKPFDLALLCVTGLAAIPAIFEAVTLKSRAAVGLSIVVVGLGIKIVSQYLRARKAYVAQVTHELYRKNQDNDAGVLQYLIDAVEEQELKEALLAFAILHGRGESMRAEAIDAAVEEWVHARFEGTEFDFEVQDALRLLGPGHLDLVVEEEGSFRARPLDRSLAQLEQQVLQLIKK